MSNLKLLRERIKSIKATKKITSAMKLVATSHFKKLDEPHGEARAYGQAMQGLLQKALAHRDLHHEIPSLLKQPQGQKHLLILMGSDRGLCGGFNLNIVKEAVRHSKTLEGEVSLLCLGSKVPLSLPQHLKTKVIKTLPMKEKNTYASILNMAYRLEADHGRQVFHTCTVIYSHFKSAICCVPKAHQIIPLKEPMTGLDHEDCPSLFGVDPEMDTLLKMLALKSVASHLYYASVESQRSEQSARMMAMDNATRSAEDMLAKLELVYHRSRQSAITNELIEIVAGAESL